MRCAAARVSSKFLLQSVHCIRLAGCEYINDVIRNDVLGKVDGKNNLLP